MNILETIGRKIPAGRILSRSYGLIYPGELAEAKGVRPKPYYAGLVDSERVIKDPYQE